MPKVTRVRSPRKGDGIAHPQLVNGGIQKGQPKYFCRYRRNLLLATTFTLALSHHSFAARLSSTDFATLASRCAPAVSPTILQAVARTESGFYPWALHDDTTGQREIAVSRVKAQADSTRWLRHGDAVDVGLMQVSSANFSALGLSVQSALDPCTSLAAGAEVLRAAFGGDNEPADQQVALLMALSRYNTGSPLRGILNGYARTVLGNEGLHVAASYTGNDRADSNPNLNMPPDWNVAESGRYAEVHGAPWLISFSSGTSSTSSVR